MVLACTWIFIGVPEPFVVPEPQRLTDITFTLQSNTIWLSAHALSTNGSNITRISTGDCLHLIVNGFSRL